MSVKTLATLCLITSARLAIADDEAVPSTPAPDPTPAPAMPAPAPVATVATTTPAVGEPEVHAEQVDHKKPMAHLLHGFRVGAMYVKNIEKPTREGKDSGTMTSLKEQFDLKAPYSMLLGYEGMYRVMSQSWLNVILVGNVTVAGLEQSKFIPAVSGLIGAEFDQSFQIGLGVNLVPDDQSPSHMIVAAGWTPKVGTIYTPIHFFVVPDPVTKNTRFGTTVGVSW